MKGFTVGVAAFTGLLLKLLFTAAFFGNGFSFEIETRSGDGAAQRFEYDPAGNRMAAIDALGRTTQFVYDGRNRNIQAVYADGAVEQTHFDGAGRVEETVDALGRRTAFTYDVLGRLLTTTDALGETSTRTYTAFGEPATMTDRRGNEHSYRYDKLGRVIVTRGPEKLLTSTHYDANGNVSKEIRYDLTGLTPTQPMLDDPINNIYAHRHRVTQYTYDELDRLTHVTDPLGQVTATTYDLAGRVASTTDKRGFTTDFEYDAAGRRDEEILPDPDGAGTQGRLVRQTVRDAAGNVIERREKERIGGVDTDLRTTSLAYDARNRLIQTTDAEGGVSQTVYDPAGQVVATVDALGRATITTYDLRGRIVRTTAPDPDREGPQLSPVTRATYDAVGNRVSATDALGRVTQFAYDDLNRLLTTTLPDPDGPGLQTSPVLQSSYDEEGNRETVTDPLGRVTTYVYDGLNRVTQETRPDPDGPTGSLPAPSTTSTYDALGNLVRVEDHLGRVTEYRYDALNRRTTEILPDPDLADPDVDPPVRHVTYDQEGRLRTRTDARGRVTAYEYDGRGRLVREHRPDPDQAVLSTVTIDDGDAGFSTPGGWTADTAGHQGDSRRRAAEGFNGAADWTFAVSQAGWYRVSAAWPAAAGQAEDAAYSVLADAVRLDRIAAGPTTAFAYDALGRQTKVTDALGRETAFEYDGLDRVTKTTQPDPDGGGPDLAPQTVSVYDAVGQLLEEKQRLTLDQGQPVYITTGYGYDALGRRTRVTDANGDATAYVYDAVGNLLSVTDASENTTTFVYDDLDRLESETNQSGHTRTYEYDAVGNRTRMTDRNGRMREFTYDGLDRPDEERWLDDQAQVVETIDWDYDAAGRLQSVTDGDSAYAYTYDRLDRLKTVSNAGTSGAPVVVFTSTYDAVGNELLRSETIGGQAAGSITSVYDGLDRLIRREQSGTGVSAKRVDLDYNALGQYTTITRYADLAGTELVAASTYGYDGTNRLEDLDHAQGATPLAGYHLDYDPLSRITGFTADADGTSTLGYDALGQLESADHASQSQADESYAYDDTGNRTGTDYVTVDDNRVTTDGRFTYEYDQEGNRTRRTDLLEGVSIEYEWDHRNRLIGLVFYNQLGTRVRTVEYDYDADGRRIAKHVDDDLDGQIDTTVRFVYDGPHAALVFDGAGSLTNRYLHGDEIDQVFADENAVGDVLWPLADHQHTVRDLAEYDAGTDMTTVANHRTFDSFGNVTAETNAAVDHLFAYTGREWDADAELYNYRARWYDPQAGRFVSEDPLGFDAGDVNLTRYVTNSPWNFADPTGLNAISPIVQTAAQIVAPTATNFVNTVTAWSGALRNWSGGLNHAYDLAGGGNDVALQAAVAATSNGGFRLTPETIQGLQDWTQTFDARLENVNTWTKIVEGQRNQRKLDSYSNAFWQALIDAAKPSEVRQVERPWRHASENDPVFDLLDEIDYTHAMRSGDDRLLHSNEWRFGNQMIVGYAEQTFYSEIQRQLEGTIHVLEAVPGGGIASVGVYAAYGEPQSSWDIGLKLGGDALGYGGIALTKSRFGLGAASRRTTFGPNSIGAAQVPVEHSGRLVHLTNAEAGAAINRSSTLVGGTYAGPLSNGTSIRTWCYSPNRSFSGGV